MIKSENKSQVKKGCGKNSNKQKTKRHKDKKSEHVFLEKRFAQKIRGGCLFEQSILHTTNPSEDLDDHVRGRRSGGSKSPHLTLVTVYLDSGCFSRRVSGSPSAGSHGP